MTSEGEKKSLRPASYVKVEDVTPGTHGHNLVLRIVSVTPLEAKKRQDGNAPRMAEAVVGDETGIVTLTARNEQIDSLKEGSDIVIRNCNADVYNGYLRLNVTRWGKITPYPDGVASTPKPPTEIKMENDFSAIEYELVTVEGSEEED